MQKTSRRMSSTRKRRNGKSSKDEAQSKEKIKGYAQSISGKGVSAVKRVTDSGAQLVNYFVASDAVTKLEQFLGHTFNEGVPTVYDKAMDAFYNATHIGGGNLHRLFDGSHTLWGAWEKCKEALPNDSLSQEVFGYLKALGHDLSSPAGLPVADMSKEGYEKFASWLESIGIERSLTQDLLHINTPELIGSTIGSLALIFRWNSKDISKFANIVATIGITSCTAANPLGIIITLVGLARSYQLAVRSDAKIGAINGLLRGAVKSSLFIGTSGIIGGPVWIGIVTALVIYLLTNRHIENVNILEMKNLLQNVINTMSKLPTNRVIVKNMISAIKRRNHVRHGVRPFKLTTGLV